MKLTEMDSRTRDLERRAKTGDTEALGDYLKQQRRTRQ
jgi:hypothetical protein